MTILAGAWHHDRQPLPPPLEAALVGHLSRHTADAPAVIRAPGCVLAKVDIGAYGAPALHQDSSGAITLLSGEALLADRPVGSGHRLADTVRLHEALRDRADAVLRLATGTYATASYFPDSHRLVLATDPLGTRALYVCDVDGWTVFSTALRVLTQLPGVRLSLDTRGATEQIFLQAPLAGRTVFGGVTLLQPAEVREFVPGRAPVSREVMRWDDVPAWSGTREEALDAVHGTFLRAVERRRQGDTTTTALLSGGLDSRLTVAALLRAGSRVRTLNFSLEGSLDEQLGRQYAEAAGTQHVSRPYRAGLQDSYEQMAAEVLHAGPADAHAPERPLLLWSSFGGSAVLGQINNKPIYVELCRAGKVPEAVERYMDLKHLHVPRRLFTARHAAALAEVTRRGIHEGLAQLAPADPGRLIDLFIVGNSMRVQLHPHQEEVDVLRLEHQSPMFDVEWVRLAQALPQDWLREHRFYMDWLPAFGPPVTTIPWQSYPGHVACPLPLPQDARRQWDIAAARGFRRKAVLRAARRLVAGPAPFDLLDRRFLAVAAVLHALGIRNYAYAVRAAQRYTAWWDAGGRLPVPLPGADA